MKKWKHIMLGLGATMLLGACDGAEAGTSAESTAGKQATMDAIKADGVLTVGVKEDVPGFGMRDTASGEIEGYEIDLAKKIAEELLGDPEAVKLVPVTAKTRGPLLDNGELDMVVATFTITEERKETYHFTPSYYQDAVGLLVKKDNGYTGLKDLDGITIGVSQSSTTKDAILTEAEQYGIDLNFSEYATYPEIKAALDSNRVQAFSVDRSILSGYLDDTTEILPDRFATQDYGIAVKKQNTDVAEFVDGLITAWEGDGTLADMQAEWGIGE